MRKPMDEVLTTTAMHADYTYTPADQEHMACCETVLVPATSSIKTA
jgi:hypothetical protein